MTIVTVGADARSKTEAFSHDKHAPFSMLSDPHLKIINAWGVRERGKQLATPSMFLVRGFGRVVLWRYIGSSMTDRPSVDRALEVINQRLSPFRLVPPPVGHPNPPVRRTPPPKRRASPPTRKIIPTRP